MWGTLKTFAVAAAEQVQKEALNIASDVSEVTKQGFDLLEKLDNSLDVDEGNSDSERKEGEEADEGPTDSDAEIAVAVASVADTNIDDIQQITDEKKPAAANLKESSVALADPKLDLNFLRVIKLELECSPGAELSEILEAVKAIKTAHGESMSAFAASKVEIDKLTSDRHAMELLLRRSEAHAESLASELRSSAEIVRDDTAAVKLKESEELRIHREEIALLSRQKERDHELIATLHEEKEHHLSELGKLHSLHRELQASLDEELRKVDTLTLSNIELTSKIHTQALQLVDGESVAQELATLRREKKELTRAHNTTLAELQSVSKKAESSEAIVHNYSAMLEQLKADHKTLKERYIAVDHECAHFKRVAEVSSSRLEEIPHLEEVIGRLTREKEEREQLYATSVRSLDEALSQVHELSIALHNRERTAALEAPLSSAGSSSVPSTPSSSHKELSVAETPFSSPDIEAFKTPGILPQSAAASKKKGSKKKNKAEVLKEIAVLNSQVKSIREQQVTHLSYISIYKSIYISICI